MRTNYFFQIKNGKVGIYIFTINHKGYILLRFVILGNDLTPFFNAYVSFKVFL